jgi:hypothetical protein
MSSFILTDQKSIDFFQKHDHLDFNVMNGIFVDIMEKLLQNMSDNIENGHNTALIKHLSKRVESMETSFSQHNEGMMRTIGQFSDKFSALINQHQEAMLSHMRDTMKSNNGDTEKSIMGRIYESNEVLLTKMSAITKNNDMLQFMETEIGKLNGKVREESERMLASVEKSSGHLAIEKISEMISGHYKDLDNAFKARIESFFSSHSSTQGSMYTEIMNRLEKTTTAVDVVGDYFQKQIGSTNKGKQGEAKLEVLLSQMFPNAEIINTSGMTACGDFIVERNGKSKVLLDTKDYDTVVPVKEVEKIIRDIENNKCHGVLLSQNSGIAKKEDFEINVHDQNIIIFLHHVGYNTERIQMAFNIIDHLEPYLVKSGDGEQGETISCDLLTLINKEYQELVTQKLNLIQSIKKSQGDLIGQVQKMDLPMLTNYLDKKFANTGKTGLTCDKCNVFIGKNAKSLAMHKRHCKPATQVIETFMNSATLNNS